MMSYWSVSFAYLIDIDSLATDQRFEVSVNLVGIDLMKDVGDQCSPLTLPPTHTHTPTKPGRLLMVTVGELPCLFRKILNLQRHSLLASRWLKIAEIIYSHS